MIHFSDYVTFSFDDIWIASHLSSTCLEVLQRWTRQALDRTESGFCVCGHRFIHTVRGDLHLDEIVAETWEQEVELLYRVLAPFVSDGGVVQVSDDQDQHVRYSFRRCRVFRCEGRIAFDGREVEI